MFVVCVNLTSASSGDLTAGFEFAVSAWSPHQEPDLDMAQEESHIHLLKQK